MDFKFALLFIVGAQFCAGFSVNTGSCNCGTDYIPVCGSDGITYPNTCHISCKHLKIPSLKISYEGECKSNIPHPDVCTCSKENKPVCGSDDVTYTNDCWLNCATAHNPSLRIANYSACSPPTPKPCECSNDKLPVCGSDHITYTNDCWLNCATAKNPSLSVAFSAPCDLALASQCDCSYDNKPVCGSDSVTYTNDCWLNCATANNPSLGIAYYAACHH